MSSSTRPNKTVYVGGLAPHVTEHHLLSYFAPFGEILDVQLPRENASRRQRANENGDSVELQAITEAAVATGGLSHRGFGFVEFSTNIEADDAIDNMHLNEVEGRIVNVNLARPLKTAMAGSNRPVWQDEEWIKQFATPLQGAGEASSGAPDEDPEIVQEKAKQEAAESAT